MRRLLLNWKYFGIEFVTNMRQDWHWHDSNYLCFFPGVEKEWVGNGAVVQRIVNRRRFVSWVPRDRFHRVELRAPWALLIRFGERRDYSRSGITEGYEKS